VSTTTTITPELIGDLVRLGGYVHPLFQPGGADHLEGGTPLPGQAVLLIMGGLAEQSGELDDAIAMVEIGHVKFHRMVTAGMQLHLAIEPGDSRPTRRGDIIRHYRWIALDESAAAVAEANVVMLMSSPERISTTHARN
jgi:hypothetical protein